MLVMPLALLVASSALQSKISMQPELTVYNQGMALVKDVRSFDLKEGKQTLSVSDVASMIDPSSVSIASLSSPGSVSVLEQNYRFDLISTHAILEKSVGGRVLLIRHFGSNSETLEGTLISSPTSIVNSADGGSSQVYNGMVIKGDNGDIYLNPVGEVVVKTVPKGLISVPTLFWDVDAKAGGSNQVELSYITNGISWNADYVLNLDSASNRSDLQGWVTMTNNCGATFTDAKLKLLAGDVNQARVPGGLAGGRGFAKAARAEAAPFAEESLFEYHLYTLQRPATIRDKEIKQLSLLEGHNVAFQKRLIIDSMRDYGVYYPQENEVGGGTIQPQVRVEFLNSKENNLGMALPAGKFRIYQRDASGSVQLLGEDNINHTPRNEKISLVVGRSFDVVSNRKRTSFHILSPRSVTESFEISVRNRKQEATTVEVLERHYGDWKVTETSDKWTKEDANTMKYALNLKPNEEKAITYSVTTRW